MQCILIDRRILGFQFLRNLFENTFEFLSESRIKVYLKRDS